MKLHICENLALCTHIELLASINSSNFLNKKLSRKARVAHHWSATEITSNGTPYEPKDKLNYTNVWARQFLKFSWETRAISGSSLIVSSTRLLSAVWSVVSHDAIFTFQLLHQRVFSTFHIPGGPNPPYILFIPDTSLKQACMTASKFNPYPTAFPYGNGMVLHFYQRQESSTTKTVHKVINKGLKTYV